MRQAKTVRFAALTCLLHFVAARAQDHSRIGPPSASSSGAMRKIGFRDEAPQTAPRHDPEQRPRNDWFADGVPDKPIGGVHDGARLSPRAARAFYDRGRAWLAAKEYDKAIAAYSQVVQLGPTLTWAYIGRGSTWIYKGEIDKGVADLSEAIRLSPRVARAYIGRGGAWAHKKEYDKAIADYSQAIHLDPKLAVAYIGRGGAWVAQKEYDKAIADFNESLRLDPAITRAYSDRGGAWAQKKEYDKAIADYSQAIRLDPKLAVAYNNRAWLWSTCPDARYRDGKRAIESATRSCELTEWKIAYHLGTLAAAYAEAGHFEAAVKWQSKALAMYQDEGEWRKGRERLELFRHRKPYREDAGLPAPAVQAK